MRREGTRQRSARSVWDGCFLRDFTFYFVDEFPSATAQKRQREDQRKKRGKRNIGRKYEADTMNVRFWEAFIEVV